MADSPDPLGKRALYWMPVDPEAEGDDSLEGGVGRGGPGGVGGSHPHLHSARHARPAGKRALFSDATPADEPLWDRAVATAGDPLPARGPFTVACSRCGAVSRVGVVEFVVLQLPVCAWLPLRTFDRWMTCPACRHRTWTSVTLSR
jgi:hypothetical protein